MKIEFTGSYISAKDWGKEPVVVQAVVRHIFFWS